MQRLSFPVSLPLRLQRLSALTAAPILVATLVPIGIPIGILIGVVAGSPVGAADRPRRTSSVRVDFVRDVRPILAEKCFACHGQDEKKRQADLRLDLREGAVGRAASGRAAVVPGRPGASSLIERIGTGSLLKMPPGSTGKKLTPAEKATLKLWIAQGAQYVPHRAFQKPRRPALPRTAHPARVSNGIDAFVLSRLEKEGLTLSPPADRYALLRRLSLDLTGLPPSPHEIESFLADSAPDACEKVVDRLLASPHFGEKWARMWLDLARYADSAGYGSDPLRPNIWPYRDWVIKAFNRNLPYDQFTMEQIAGDLIPDPTQDQIIATAFHRNTMTNTEGGTDREEFRTAAVRDRAITTMQVWMGLTMGCAQCHSHKYDPITQREFYGFMAFFNQTEDNDQPDERPTLPITVPERQARIDALKSEIAALEAKSSAMPALTANGLKEEVEKKKRELAAIKPVALPIMRELPEQKRRETHLLVLANFRQRGEKVEAGTPAAFSPWPPGAPKSRLGVAQWLISRDNPLTARVAVNRFWAQLFGKGIVETEEDFGQQGASPTHPELLDWLAVEFVEHGWDVKALLKTIVLSSTYRQSSRVTPQLLAKDPKNRLLAHYPRRRLDAETVRDQALALSGLLSVRIGGPSVFPPQPAGLWQAAFNGDRTWPTSTGEDRYRRGLYTFWRRTVPYPSMATFDAPSREICAMRRIHTNTPLQALVTLNDPVYLEMAQALGRRIAREGGATVQDRVRFGLRLTLGRPPQEAQVQALVTLYTQELAHYQGSPEAAKKLATEPLGALPAGMNLAEQAAWTVVSNVLLNMDGVLTIG